MLNIDIGRYSSILKEIERNEASIFLIKKNGQSFDSNLNYLNKSSIIYCYLQSNCHFGIDSNDFLINSYFFIVNILHNAYNIYTRGKF